MATSRGGRAEWERQQRAIAREMEQQQKAAERARIAAEKEQKQQYRAAREAEIANKNERLEHRVARLKRSLSRG